MLAHNNKTGVTAQPNQESLITEWTADGFAYLVGFMATGTYSGEFTLYVNDDPWYVFQTSPANRTAYAADRGVKLPAGSKVKLKVSHDDVEAQQFKGTILGGQ